MTELPDNVTLVELFNAHLSLEKGLSANTVVSYDNDVQKLLQFLEEKNERLPSVTEPLLHEFLSVLHDIGIHPRSQARIVSGIREFFQFLKTSGYTDHNPATLLELPRLGRQLPDILTVDEIDAMEAACDDSTYEGCRNRAIIETTYCCGLRVSELVGLQMSKVDIDEGYVTVDGKGSKQRIVPIASSAGGTIRPSLRQRGHPFPQPPRRAANPHNDILHRKETLRRVRHKEKHQSAHPPSFLCHASSRGRRQSARHTGNART